MLRTYEVNFVFPKKNGFDDSFDVTKCLRQIEIPDLLLMCVLRNEKIDIRIMYNAYIQNI